MEPEPFTLDVTGWVNSEPIDMAELRGRVVLVEAFQMLCPGCVSHGIPQAQRVQRTFDRSDVVVIGLHTVFEHHEVTGPAALAAFVSEYRITFPVAIDRPVHGRSTPATMGEYQLQGTPSTLLIDRRGQLRHVALGAMDDLVLGARLGRLLSEPYEAADATPPPSGPGSTPIEDDEPSADVTDLDESSLEPGASTCRTDGICS